VKSGPDVFADALVPAANPLFSLFPLKTRPLREHPAALPPLRFDACRFVNAEGKRRPAKEGTWCGGSEVLFILL
jgi:hypothetical protein